MTLVFLNISKSHSLHSVLLLSASEWRDCCSGASENFQVYIRDHEISGEKGWCSGESTCLPPPLMWPGFDSVPSIICGLRLLLVLSYSVRFFSAYPSFPLSSKTKTAKFQFDPECKDAREMSSWALFRCSVGKQIPFPFFFLVAKGQQVPHLSIYCKSRYLSEFSLHDCLCPKVHLRKLLGLGTLGFDLILVGDYTATSDLWGKQFCF